MGKRACVGVSKKNGNINQQAFMVNRTTGNDLGRMVSQSSLSTNITSISSADSSEFTQRDQRDSLCEPIDSESRNYIQNQMIST